MQEFRFILIILTTLFFTTITTKTITKHNPPCICLRFYVPVCASDGKSYGNPCEFNCHRQRQSIEVQKMLKILKNGVVCNIDHLELVMPRYAIRGGDVLLKCEHSVPPEQLYKVEWRKGGQKIFQYIKGRKPPFRYFPTSGADLNKANSSEKQIQLSKLDFSASDSYSCIVSMETPIFSKDSESKDLTIIEPQTNDPVITFNKETYEIGEVLQANCTTSPARPPPHITWLINGEKVDDTLTKTFLNGIVHGHGYFDQKSSSVKQLEIEVSDLHVGDDGELRLICMSTIPGYVNQNENYADLRTTSVQIEIVMTEGPVEQSISENSISSSGTSSTFHLNLIIKTILIIIALFNMKRHLTNCLEIIIKEN